MESNLVLIWLEACRHTIFSWSQLCHNCGLASSSDFKEPFIVSTLTTIVFFEGKHKYVLSLLNWKFAIGFILLQQIVKKLSWNFSRRQNDSLIRPNNRLCRLWEKALATECLYGILDSSYFFQPCMPIRKVSLPSLL